MQHTVTGIGGCKGQGALTCQGLPSGVGMKQSTVRSKPAHFDLKGLKVATLSYHPIKFSII